MSSSNDSPISPKSPADDLLGELESIKDLLEDADLDDDLDIDIPILDDVVAQAQSDDGDSSALLDLNTIFDDKDEDILEGGLDLDDLDTGIAIPSFKLVTTSHEDSSTAQAPDTQPDDDAEPPAVAITPPTDTGDEEQEDLFPEQRDLAAMEPIPTLEPVTELVADSSTQSNPQSSAQSNAHNTGQTDFNIDLLIQEVVDEFIPVIEDELRQRLSACSPDLLRQLADKHLKN